MITYDNQTGPKFSEISCCGSKIFYELIEIVFKIHTLIHLFDHLLTSFSSLDTSVTPMIKHI